MPQRNQFAALRVATRSSAAHVVRSPRAPYVLTRLMLMTRELEQSLATVELSAHLGTLHGALELVQAQPTSAPLRLSLAEAKNLLPTEIVHFLPAHGDRARHGIR